MQITFGDIVRATGCLLWGDGCHPDLWLLHVAGGGGVRCVVNDACLGAMGCGATL